MRLQLKDEGAGVSYDSASQQWTARYQHETVALAFSVTEEAEEDGLYMVHWLQDIQKR